MLVGSSRSPSTSASGLFLHGRHEAVEDRAMCIHPLGAQADLAGVGEGRERTTPLTAASRSQHRQTRWRRSSAAQLEDTSFMPSATAFADGGAGARLAGEESQHVNVRVAGS